MHSVTDLEEKRKSKTAAKEEAVDKPACLLVLGMHRSGTSAFTRVLSIAGAKLPANLMSVTEDSEDGHWESNSFLEFHGRLLDELGSAWYDWRALEVGRLPVKRRKEIKVKIRDILEAEFGEAPLFVVKDPRICRFTPLFLDALQSAKIDARIVLAIRNPLEVCESLERRDGMARADAALLWLRHVLDAESATRGVKRVIVTYNHLLGDWKAVFEKMSGQLALEDMHTIAEITPQVEDFLSPGRRHHARKTEEVLLDPLLCDWVGAAYEALLALARNPRSQKTFDRLDEIAGEFNRASPVLHRLYGAVRTERDGEISGLKAALSEAENQRRALEEDFAQEKAAASKMLQKKEAALAAGQKSARELVYQLTACRLETQQARANLTLSEESRQAYENSTSWRITAPLRSGTEIARILLNYARGNGSLRAINTSSRSVVPALSFRSGTDLIDIFSHYEPIIAGPTGDASCWSGEDGITWVIPNFRSSQSGGHLNIFRMANNLKALGMTNQRIVILPPYHWDSPAQAQRAAEEYFNLKDMEFSFGAETLRPSRYVFATSWDTAYAVAHFKGAKHRCYFVQDFEPGFYAIGTEHYLALNTYNLGLTGVTAGPWLAKRLAEEHGMKTHSYTFSYDRELYGPKPRSSGSIKRVFFYARPVTLRRCFELGLLALKRVSEHDPDVVVLLAGWDVSGYKIPFRHEALGTKPLDQLADIYSGCDVALVLSGTNLSLLPMEIAACGTPLVVNNDECSRWLFSEDEVKYCNMDVQSIYDSVCYLLDNPHEAQQQAERAMRRAKASDWLSEARSVFEFLHSLDEK